MIHYKNDNNYDIIKYRGISLKPKKDSLEDIFIRRVEYFTPIVSTFKVISMLHTKQFLVDP